jgi:phospholipid/cholesterol/gamma-HCH transport system substrate-binding protein
VKRITGGVRVVMSIDRGRKIPLGSTANISRKSAIGEQYVDFFPPKDPDPKGGFLKAGDHIPRDHTTVPLEFSEFLRSASGVLGALEPDSVGTIVHELATGLDGRADSLRQLAVAGDALSKTLASRTAALDRISANGGRLTAAMANHRASLGASIDNLAALNSALAAAKDDVGVLLDKGAPLVKELADLIGNHKAELDCDLKVLEIVVDLSSTPEQVDGLRGLLTWAPKAFAGVWDARDIEAEGVWVRVTTINSLENPPNQFIPPRPLPPVTAAPGCVSLVPPSGADYAPSAGPASPTSAGGLAMGGVLVAGAAFVVLRSARAAL